MESGFRRALLFSLYKVFSRKPCFAKLLEALGSPQSRRSGAEATNAKSKAKFLRIAFLERTVSFDSTGNAIGRGSHLEFGLGIDFPQASEKGLDEPQIVSFKVGVATIYFRDVIPSNLNSKVPQLFFLVLLSLITAIGIQPVARLLGGTAGFGQAFQIACLLISFSFVLVASSCRV